MPPPCNCIPNKQAAMSSPLNSALQIHAGPLALQQIRQHGLRAQDIAVIPAAAGGPKGLILSHLDRWLFSSWLPSAPRSRSLIGASIGAWRMAAACQTDAVQGFASLAEHYCQQRYSARPSEQEVGTACERLLADCLDGQQAAICQHAHFHLHIVTARGKRFLRAPQKKWQIRLGFAAAALANLATRAGLAGHLQRVVVGDTRDDLFWLRDSVDNSIEHAFDQFQTAFAPLAADNLAQALLASGTLPLIMPPLRNLRHAPPGTYWDGGLIDYHLALPYVRLWQQKPGELVLYPHFEARIVPGWFDKSLPWRRALRAGERHWLDNVILLSPSPAFIQGLPRRKLPDRQDFFHFGQQHNARIRDWQQAIGEGERLRDALAQFVANPDVTQIQPLFAA